MLHAASYLIPSSDPPPAFCVGYISVFALIWHTIYQNRSYKSTYTIEQPSYIMNEPGLLDPFLTRGINTPRARIIRSVTANTVASGPD